MAQRGALPREVRSPGGDTASVPYFVHLRALSPFFFFPVSRSLPLDITRLSCWITYSTVSTFLYCSIAPIKPTDWHQRLCTVFKGAHRTIGSVTLVKSRRNYEDASGKRSLINRPSCGLDSGGLKNHAPSTQKGSHSHPLISLPGSSIRMPFANPPKPRIPYGVDRF